VGEICAIISATEKVPRFQPLLIITDSKYAIDGLTTHLEEWKNKGWIEVKNANFFKRAAYLL
jgi:ribonuclease HI